MKNKPTKEQLDSLRRVIEETTGETMVREKYNQDAIVTRVLFYHFAYHYLRASKNQICDYLNTTHKTTLVYAGLSHSIIKAGEYFNTIKQKTQLNGDSIIQMLGRAKN